MSKQCSYVIVPTDGRRRLSLAGHRPPALVAGRHRLGAPGTSPRYPAGPPRPSAGRKARHRRRTARRSAFAVRYATLLVLLGAVGISGWFAATGATAVAQMIQP